MSPKVHICSKIGLFFSHLSSLAGISRSTTVTVAYLMTISDFNWYDCLRVVRHVRSVALPNFGFQKQLQEFEHTKLTEVRF